jgi:hypothetical protein
MDGKKCFFYGGVLSLMALALYELYTIKPNPAAAPVDAVHAAGTYFSTQNTGVYHVCRNCPSGRRINPRNRTAGTGGGVLCANCSDLISSGECV